MGSEFALAVQSAWQRSEGKCQCTRFGHDHPYVRCTKSLIWDKQDKPYPGGWKVNSRPSHSESPNAFEILCWGCYIKTNR